MESLLPVLTGVSAVLAIIISVVRLHAIYKRYRRQSQR